MNDETIYTVDLTVYIPGTGVSTLYYATHGVVYGGNYYEPRLKQPGNFSQNTFSSGTTRGASQTGYGEIILLNPDGGLDAMTTYGFDGRKVVLRKIIAGVATILMSCSMEQPTPSWDEVPIRIKDKQQVFNVAIQPTKYLGNNVLPDGVEGTDDIKGQPKPLLYGYGYNISPVCVNTARLIYQVSDSALLSITAVRDRGVPLTAGTAYTTAAEMQANPPTPGTYRVYLAGGMFRLGSLPSGAITCDATEGSTAASRSAAQIANRIALRVITAGEIDSADITALDTANNAEVGTYISTETTISSVLDSIIGSIGGWYGFDSVGVLNMGRIEAPAAGPIATLTEAEIIEIQRNATNDQGRGVPPYKVNLNYNKNHTIQPAGTLAGSAANELTWTNYSRPTQWDGSNTRICYGNGLMLKYDLVTPPTQLAISVDGLTWEKVTVSATSYMIHDIAFGNGVFLAVGSNGASTPVAFRSVDGRSWTQVTAPPAIMANLKFGNGVFVGVPESGTLTASSVDGTTWTSGTIPSAVHNMLEFGGGYFMSVTWNGATAYRSANGTTWTSITLPYAGGWVAMVYASATWAILDGSADKMIISRAATGTSWQTILLPAEVSPWYGLAFGDGKFIIVGPSKFAAISTDAVIWQKFPLPASNLAEWEYVTYINSVGFLSLRTSSTALGIYGPNPVAILLRLSKEYQTVTATDATVLTKHPNSQELNINTLIISSDRAQIEANRLLALYKVDRDYLTLTVHSSVLPSDVLGKDIWLQIPRYGYTNGKLFKVFGVRYDYESGFTSLDIWG